MRWWFLPIVNNLKKSAEWFMDNVRRLFGIFNANHHSKKYGHHIVDGSTSKPPDYKDQNVVIFCATCGSIFYVGRGYTPKEARREFYYATTRRYNAD